MQFSCSRNSTVGLNWTSAIVLVLLVGSGGCERSSPPLDAAPIIAPPSTTGASTTSASKNDASAINPSPPAASPPTASPPVNHAPQEADVQSSTSDVSIVETSIWEGVYTQSQSRRGELVYADACASCHGEQLEGEDVVPELVGEKFLQRWNRKRVGNLFVYTKNEMPLKQEERLAPNQYADVIAYILAMNGSPAGTDELPHQFAPLQSIRFQKPE